MRSTVTRLFVCLMFDTRSLRLVEPVADAMSIPAWSELILCVVQASTVAVCVSPALAASRDCIQDVRNCDSGL